jgi:hypothetical protein
MEINKVGSVNARKHASTGTHLCRISRCGLLGWLDGLESCSRGVCRGREEDVKSRREFELGEQWSITVLFVADR